MEKVFFDFQKLRGRIVEILGNQNILANKLGVSNVSLSRKLNNKSKFSPDDIIIISDILKIPKDEIGVYFFNQKV